MAQKKVYLIGIDIGTQGTKAALFDHHGRTRAVAFRKSALHRTQPGVVEEDPEHQLKSVCQGIRSCVRTAGIDPADVMAVGIDGQMAGVLGVGPDGVHVTPYDSWLDTRCAPHIGLMQKQAGKEISTVASRSSVVCFGWPSTNGSGSTRCRKSGCCRAKWSAIVGCRRRKRTGSSPVALPHLAAMARLALATGCRAREIAGLEWRRVDLQRRTAWLDETKYGTPRGVPLNRDAVLVLEEQTGKHSRFCFTYRGKPVRWELTNTAWVNATRKAGLTNVRFHDRRHTWASWHRQSGTRLRRVEGTGRLEIPFDGRPLREVCYGES